MASSTLTSKPTARRARSHGRPGSMTKTATALTAIVLALCTIGVIMVGSASPVISEATYGSPWSILENEVMFMVVGLVGFAVVSRRDYHRLSRLGAPLLVVSFALLAAVLEVGHQIYGAKRWIGLSVVTIQPSELAKLAIVIFCADLIARRTAAGSSEGSRSGPVLILAGLAAGLIVAEPDMGTAAVVVVIAVAMLFAAGMPWKPAAKLGLVLGVLAGAVAVLSPYRRARLLGVFNPEAHAQGSGYQVVQSMIGIGSGHLTGVGLGASKIKWGSLPNAHTDFIFSILGEELGLVGTLGVIVLFGVLIAYGLRVAHRAPDLFGALLAIGVVAWIGLEAIINIASVIGVFPVTGIPLPLISYGGTSLITTLLACGILVAVARQELPADALSNLGPRPAPVRRSGVRTAVRRAPASTSARRTSAPKASVSTRSVTARSTAPRRGTPRPAQPARSAAKGGPTRQARPGERGAQSSTARSAPTRRPSR